MEKRESQVLVTIQVKGVRGGTFLELFPLLPFSAESSSHCHLRVLGLAHGGRRSSRGFPPRSWDFSSMVASKIAVTGEIVIEGWNLRGRSYASLYISSRLTTEPLRGYTVLRVESIEPYWVKRVNRGWGRRHCRKAGDFQSVCHDFLKRHAHLWSFHRQPQLFHIRKLDSDKAHTTKTLTFEKAGRLN